MRPIDADAVKDVIAELNDNGYDISPSDLAFVRNILLRMPTIEPKRGKWETEVRTIHGHKIPFFACSVCGKNADDEYRYCPNCGAKMERSE